MLRPLPADLDELAGILEGDPLHGGGRIDLETREVWPQAAIEYGETGEEDENAADDPERWLSVHCEGTASSTSRYVHHDDHELAAAHRRIKRLQHDPLARRQEHRRELAAARVR